MALELEELIAQIHGSSTRVVLAIAGGGSRAISHLLEAPGASRTVLEAVVPYSVASMGAWLGALPEQACSAPTARAMAMAAFRRAWRYHGEPDQVAGIACTASLATDRPKRGPHRAHLAMQTAALTATRSLRLAKGMRSRAAEEDLVSRIVLNLVAEACGVAPRLALDLRDEERVDQSLAVAPAPWRDLLLGRVEIVRHGRPVDRGSGSGRTVFPGAFHPLHSGHRRMAQLAQQMLGVPVEFEMSIMNVDKPPLDYFEIQQRTEQFSDEQIVWLTRAPTFMEKSTHFPGATFVVGADTICRVAEVRYYGNDLAARDAALRAIASQGCRFLVFGRKIGERFVTLWDLDLPGILRDLCRGVPGEQFREDVSSTEIRQGESGRSGEE